MSIRLMAVDNHPLILLALENLFKEQNDFEFVAGCLDSDKVLDLVRLHKPDIVLIDIRHTGKNGLEIVREILAETHLPRIVIYTEEISEEQMLAAIRLGVQGIILKQMSTQLLLACVRRVYEGGKWLELHSARLTLENMLRREAGARELAGLVTRRESTIVKMVADGSRNKEIADKLFISEGTVKVHLHNIYEKLGVESRLDLLRFAREKGLL